ncbi:MAG TPA: DNA polymerase, partial [Nitrosopumilaceae archaeon]|nr:DNA polymerase [Nitrosopumilaceae archaeon]
MTAYQDILAPNKKLVQIEFTNPKPRSKKITKPGCQFCPANKKGIKKIKGLTRIKGKKIFVWLRNPGKDENIKGLEAVGRAGKWLWDELKLVGLSRSDVDLQNVVRCFTPVFNEEENFMEDKEPTTEIAKCCSKYTQRALEINGGKAKVHLVFGQFAAKVLLGREYKKDQPIFWSEKLQARVVCLDHPSYFLHGAPKHRLEQFRERLKVALHSVQHSGKYSFLKSQDYQLIKNPTELKEYLKYAKKFAIEKKRSIVVDIETGWLLKNYDSDKLRKLEVTAETPGARAAMLVIGLTHAPGRARVVVLDHPDAKLPSKHVKRMKGMLKRFLEDEAIEKVMHYGSSDFTGIKDILGISIKNYWFDTNYSTYLMWPDLKKYGLDNLSKEKVPEFAGYKDIIKEYLVKDKHNYATIPLKIMKWYNGADCDVTKRLEILTRKPMLERSKHSKPLLRTYRHVAFQLMKITPRGPFFDYRYCKVFKKELKQKIKDELRALRRSCKVKDLNPRSTIQVKAVIYKRLKLPMIEVKRKIGRTDENTIKVLQAQSKHPFLTHLLEYRGLEKMRSQLVGYMESANTYEGRLRTIWWLTGAITGRLRSGGK